MSQAGRKINEVWRQRQQLASPSPFDLRKVLFEKQLPFGLSQARYQTACCTRRSGKTVGEIAKIFAVARAKPGSVCLYITLSRVNAGRVAWDIAKQLNAEWKLGGVVGEAEQKITMPNGTRCYFTGCADMGEIEKFRGLPLSIVVIDEAQSFPTSMLEKLIDEVLTPALMDFSGILVLVGTPGPVPVGYFHDCVVSPAWTHFEWSVFDNPWIKKKSGRDPQEMLADELARRGVTVDDPVIQREWFGRWILDTNSLVFQFNPQTNAREARTHQHHVIGVDLGFDDADAIAVLGWSDDAPDVDLVFEQVMAKQNITALMGQVQAAVTKYNPLAVVADTGGLGKKIADEIQSRLGVPIEAADKARKLEHIELLNDAMRTGRFFAPATSRFAQECQLVEWDRSNPEKPKISERFHSDILDAALYAYMRALAWLYVEPKPPRPKVNTPEWVELVAKERLAEVEDLFSKGLQENRRQAHEEREAAQWD